MSLNGKIIKSLNEDERNIIKQAKWGENTIAVEKTGSIHPYRLIVFYKDDLDYVKDSWYYDSEEKAIAELDRLASLKTKKFTYEEKKAFAESIDLTPLTNKIKEFCGVNDLEVKYDIEDDKYNSSCRIVFSSNDIKEHCGVFGKVMKYVIVGNFASYVVENRDKTDLRFWCGVNLHYEHKDGGSNGVELFRAEFENGNWQFN